MSVPPAVAPAAALSQFSEPTRTWFAETFARPTEAQAGAWAATARGHSVLVSAPTGSGKTLVAFLAAVDRLATTPPAVGAGTRASTCRRRRPWPTTSTAT